MYIIVQERLGRLMGKKIKNLAFAQVKLALVVLVVFSVLAPVIKSQVVNAAPPPKDSVTFTLLAAGQRSSVTAGTPDGTTVNNNGTEWYYRTGRAMGFAAGGDTVDLVGGANADRGTTNPDKRLSWHIDSSSMYNGYRAGETIVSDDSYTRYVYQSDSPTYYPSGPQTNVDESDLLGWTLCWSGTYGGHQEVNEVFAELCTGDYLMYAASPSVNNYIDITKNEESVLSNVGGEQGEYSHIFAGDTIHFGLYKQDKSTSVSWDDFRVYTSNCVASSSCWPNDPVDSPGNWDSGTHVSNGMFTIPEGAENEQLYIYQADDDTGARIDNTNAIRLLVSHTPVEHTITTCEELAAIDDTTSNREIEDTYVLANDINCSSIMNFSPINFGDYFEGIFDGQGHTISNLSMNYPEDSDIGLFNGLNNAVVRNVTFSNGSIIAQSYSGVVAGESYSSELSNIHSDIDVSAEEGSGYALGGLIGYGDYERGVTLSGLSSTGDVTGDGEAMGGLFGELDVNGQEYSETSVVLEESYATGNVVSTSSYGVGGLIGYSYISNDNGDDLPSASLTLRNTYAQGDVDATNGTGAGGLIGYMDAYNSGSGSEAAINIDKSYASGHVSADSDAGGLIGYVDQLSNENENLSISDSFAAGLVEAREGAAYAIIGSDSYLGGDGNLYLDNVYFDETATNQSYPDYSELGDWSPVNNDGDDPDYFKNNSTNSPLDTWDFEDVWVANSDTFPTFRAVSGSSDADTDGISDDQEDSVLNEGDGNDDGTPDSGQPNVASFLNSIDGKYVTVVADEDCALSAVSADTEASKSAQDADYVYQYGLVSFTAVCAEQNGFTANFQVFFHGVEKQGLVLRKYNSTTNQYSGIEGSALNEWEFQGQVTTVAEYSVTDGSSLDSDGEANGTIVDPVGLGSQSTNQANDLSNHLAVTGQSMMFIVALASLLVGTSLAMHKLSKRDSTKV